jgi:RNA-directed DNA polymerase
VLLTRGDVAALVGLRPKTLFWWIYALEERRRYTTFNIERRNAEDPRQISAPIKPLKDIQRTLVDILTPVYSAPPQVHGFVPDRSARTNARRHRRQKWVLRLDLKDFFPSIHFGRVWGLFKAKPFEYPSDVAATLAQICCHEGTLPQGAPTSPIISNFICWGLDKDLSRLATKERCYYSRYADDICLSTDRSIFPASLASISDGITELGPTLQRVIAEHDFEINNAKTRLMSGSTRQRVTGLVVNEKVNVPRQYVRNLRSLLYIWERYGLDAAKAALDRTGPPLNWPPEKADPVFEQVVRGRVQHVGSIKGWDDPVYERLAEKLHRCDPTFSPTQPPQPSSQAIRLFTEGKTDIDHMLAAERYFHSRGEFLDISFSADSNSSLGGHDQLLRHCQHLSRAEQPPTLCLFDRDTPHILKDAIQDEGWKNWGSGVLSLAIVPPTWRSDERLVCIEMLFEDSLLMRVNGDGRRVFLATEFDPRAGHHQDGIHTTPHPGLRPLVAEEVFAIGTEGTVNVSKSDFAEAVAQGSHPYADASFEGFRGTFELVREAIASL